MILEGLSYELEENHVIGRNFVKEFTKTDKSYQNILENKDYCEVHQIMFSELTNLNKIST